MVFLGLELMFCTDYLHTLSSCFFCMVWLCAIEKSFPIGCPIQKTVALDVHVVSPIMSKSL